MEKTDPRPCPACGHRLDQHRQAEGSTLIVGCTRCTCDYPINPAHEPDAPTE